MVEVAAVRREDVPGVWSRVEPLLRPSIEHQGTHGANDVLRALLDGDAWLVTTTDMTACAVVEIVVYPRLRVMRVWLAGAARARWATWRAIENFIAEGARHQGCAALETIGRRGWARLFPGAHEVGTAYRRML